MKLILRGHHLALLVILLLSIAAPTHQYVYSCNATAACGCSSNPASMTRIVGGETAGTSTWGWAVSINIESEYLCGGSILSSTWIVTAAHCIVTTNPSKFTIYAGSNVQWSGQARIAASITVHPSYNSVTHQNDIALIRLATPLDMSDPNVAPICMPYVSSAVLAAGEWPPAGLYVVAVGWGTLSSGGSLPTYLQQVTLQTIDYRLPFCSSVLNNSVNQLCAGVIGGGKDTCQGDSGGPLAMYTTSNQWELVGLTSYGIGCAEATHAGVYTRVAYFQSWISSTTSNAFINAASSTSANVNPYTTPNTTDISATSHLVASPFILGTMYACMALFVVS